MIQKIAVKAILVNKDGEVLVLRKSSDDIRHSGNSGKYNLPGGKIDAGETITDALAREIKEETSLHITNTNLQPFFAGDWRPTVNGKQIQIIGMFFICKQWSGEISLSDEHDSYAWINPQTISEYTILPPEDQAILQYFKG